MLAQIAHFSASEDQWSAIREILGSIQNSGALSHYEVESARAYRNHNNGRCTIIVSVNEGYSLEDFSGSSEARETSERLSELVGNVDFYEAEVFE